MFLFPESTNEIKEPVWIDIRDHNVIITTLASARMLWKFYHDGKLQFTHILIDEAAQAWEPECLTPLVLADKQTKIVLAGDHKQVMYYNDNLESDFETQPLTRLPPQGRVYCRHLFMSICGLHCIKRASYHQDGKQEPAIEITKRVLGKIVLS